LSPSDEGTSLNFSAILRLKREMCKFHTKSLWNLYVFVLRQCQKQKIRTLDINALFITLDVILLDIILPDHSKFF